MFFCTVESGSDEHGEYPAVVRSQSPTSTTDEEQSSNYGIILVTLLDILPCNVHLCMGLELDTAESEVDEHGEHLDSSVVQTQVPTSTSEEQQLSNYGTTLLKYFTMQCSSLYGT